MKITLYQMTLEPDNAYLLFRDLKSIQTTCGNRIPAEGYEAVYHGELDIQTVEDAFYIFNMEHPEGYRGRSLSVSDVVEIFDPEKGYVFYFCDTFGFWPVAFDREKVKQRSTAQEGQLDESGMMEERIKEHE